MKIYCVHIFNIPAGHTHTRDLFATLAGAQKHAQFMRDQLRPNKKWTELGAFEWESYNWLVSITTQVVNP
jgi:hypothetical protein